MKLYDLTEQYNRVSELLESADNREALKDTLDSLEDAFDSKVESIVKLMKSKDAEHDVIKAEATRLSERAARIAKESEWLKQYIEGQMIASNREKVNSSLFNITLAKNPPAVNVLNESEVPQDYFTTKTVTSLDKRTILERLQGGETIPGVEMIQRKSLRIK